jgi:hypothetical protein
MEDFMKRKRFRSQETLSRVDDRFFWSGFRIVSALRLRNARERLQDGWESDSRGSDPINRGVPEATASGKNAFVIAVFFA